MLTYKNIEWTEVLESGNLKLIEGMANSFASKKTRNKGNAMVVKECEQAIQAINEWKQANGYTKQSKRGIYDEVKDLKALSDDELGAMYESLYSRRWYYEKTNNKAKLAEIGKRIDQVKAERTERNKAKVLG